MSDDLIPLDLNKKPIAHSHGGANCEVQNAAIETFRATVKPRALLLFSLDEKDHAVFALEGKQADMIHALSHVISKHPYIGDLFAKALSTANNDL